MAAHVPFFPMKLSQTTLADWGSCVVPDGKHKGMTFEKVVVMSCSNYRSRRHLKSIWAQSLCAYASLMNDRHRFGKNLFNFNRPIGGLCDASRSGGGGGGGDASRSGGGGGGGDDSHSGGGDSFHIDDKLSSSFQWASDGRCLGRKRQQATRSRSIGDAVSGGGGGDAVNGQDKHGGGVECDAVNGGDGGGGDAVNGGGVECDKHGGGDAVNGQDNDDGMTTIVLKIPRGWKNIRVQMS
jgi:hypothetical protein